MVRHRTPRSARRETAGGGRGPGGARVGRTRGTPRGQPQGWRSARRPGVGLGPGRRDPTGVPRGGARRRSLSPRDVRPERGRERGGRPRRGRRTGRGRRRGGRRARGARGRRPVASHRRIPARRGRRRDPGASSRARRPTPALERFPPPPNKRLFCRLGISRSNGAGTTDATPRGSIPEAERLAVRSTPSPSARAVAEANPRARACDRGRTPERPFFDFSHPRRRNVVTHADFATWEVSAHVSSAQRSTSGRPPYSACLRELGPHPLAPLRGFVLVRVLQYIRARLPP